MSGHAVKSDGYEPRLHGLYFQGRRFRWYPEHWPFGMQSGVYENVCTLPEAYNMAMKLTAKGARGVSVREIGPPPAVSAVTQHGQD